MKYDELKPGQWYVVPSEGTRKEHWIFKFEKLHPEGKYPIGEKYGKLNEKGNWKIAHFSGAYIRSEYREATADEILFVFPNEKLELDYDIY